MPAPAVGLDGGARWARFDDTRALAERDAARPRVFRSSGPTGFRPIPAMRCGRRHTPRRTAPAPASRSRRRGLRSAAGSTSRIPRSSQSPQRRPGSRSKDASWRRVTPRAIASCGRPRGAFTLAAVGAAGAPARAPFHRGRTHPDRGCGAARGARAVASPPVATETDASTQVHGGRLVAARLRAHGVTKLFTLSGGHLFSIYDGCRAEGIEIVDVRHEQAAAFAAEGWAKVTRIRRRVRADRRPRGHQRDERDRLRAPRTTRRCWCSEGGPRSFAGARDRSRRSITFRSSARSSSSPPPRRRPPRSRRWSTRRCTTAITPHSGPAFLDFPLDQVFGEADEPRAGRAPPEPWPGPAADARAIERAAASLRDAERPVIMAGTGLYWGRGEEALRALAEELRIPVFLNGLGRGCLPADHELAFSRLAERRAAGGRRRARDRRAARLPARLRRRVRPGRGRSSRSTSPSPTSDPPRQLAGRALRRAAGDARRAPCRRRRGRRRGVGARRVEPGPSARRGSSRCARPRTSAAPPRPPSSPTTRAPLHPMRIYGELAQMLDRDAIVIGDGGDFVSYAGRRGRLLRARLLAGSRAARLPRAPGRVRARRQAGPSRAPGGAAARRRRLRLLRDGVRHARPPRRGGRRR